MSNIKKDQNNVFSRNIEYKSDSSICVLIFHGLSSTPYDMREMAEEIHQLGVNVFVPLLPYHGINYQEINRIEDSEAVYRWGFDLIESKKQEFEKLIIIGFSYGVGITLYSQAQKMEADGIILFSVGSKFTIKVRFLAVLAKLFGLKDITRERSEYYTHGALSEEYLNWRSTNFSKFPISQLVFAVKYVRKQNRELENITAPIMIIHGTEDSITSQKAPKFVMKRVKSRKKLTIYIQEGKHSLHLSNFRFKIYKYIKQFITEILNESQSLETERIITISSMF